VTLFTRERGKASAVAKGIKKPASKLAAGLQLFSHSTVQLAAGRSLEVITQVRPIDIFYHIREEWTRYGHACYVAELLDMLTDEDAPDAACFDLLLATLGALNAGADPPTLVRAFELKMMRRLGYGPELDLCVACGAEAGDAKAGFSATQGGITCERCLAVEDAVPLSSTARQAMDDLLRLPIGELAEKRLGKSARDELALLMRSFVDYHLTRPLRSAAFLSD
jgi:DNA repair protein RecO (recombination protein O)